MDKRAGLTRLVPAIGLLGVVDGAIGSKPLFPAIGVMAGFGLAAGLGSEGLTAKGAAGLVLAGL